MCTSFSIKSLNYKFKLIKFYNIIYIVNEIRLDLKLKIFMLIILRQISML